MTRKELDKLLWQTIVDWWHDTYKEGNNEAYSVDAISVVINNIAYEIEVEYVDYQEKDDNGILIELTPDTPHKIRQITWMEYSENFYHDFVDFDEFCKEFNIE